MRGDFERGVEEKRSVGEDGLKRIEEIYGIEEFGEWGEYRGEEGGEVGVCEWVGVLDWFEKWMEGRYVKVGGKRGMGEGIWYGYGLWGRMKGLVKEGNIKIENNVGENGIGGVRV